MSYPHKFWKKYFRYYDCLMELIPYQQLLEKMALLIGNDHEIKMLDLGSGTGNIQHFLNGQMEITSFDNSEAALERLQQKFPKQVAIRGSILEPLPFLDNCFDTVFSNNVLYTMPSDVLAQVVGEIKRVLKPEGKVVVSNLTKGFSPQKIYGAHIKMYFRRHGVLRTIIHLTKLIWPTIRIFQLNRIIQNNGMNGSYHFFDMEEQKRIFIRSGFKNLIPTQRVYANQAELDMFKL